MSVTGSARAVVLAEHRDRGLLIVGRLQRDEPAIHEVRDSAVERRQQELANANVVDQHALLVDDVDHVQRFAVLAMRADVVEHLAHGPLLADRDVVRRHQPADGLFRIAEQRQRDGPFRRREQRQQLAGGLGRQLLEEHRPVVRRHVVQQLGDVLLRHRLQQRLLRVVRQVLEHRGGILPRQHAEDDDLIFEAELPSGASATSPAWRLRSMSRRRA